MTYEELEAIKAILGHWSPETMPYQVFENREEYDGALRQLAEKGIIRPCGGGWLLTERGEELLRPYKVENAVILAAGGSDMSSKSIYSLPKGLFIKDGETLIERQIRQLRDVGIYDITVVVGYKQELYFFLMEKYGVRLAVNVAPSKGNVLSLAAQGVELSNTYICNCDNYFAENPFSPYEYRSFHATIQKDDTSHELVVRKDADGRIAEVVTQSNAGECIYGHAYMDRAFSARFKELLVEQLSLFRVDMLFWEEFLSRNADVLDMKARCYDSEYLLEFDSVQEIQNIDGLFLDNVSQKVNEKICAILNCKPDEIANIEILPKGLTNILFSFSVHDERYIFRYPGDFSEAFIYRDREVRAQKMAAEAGVDTTYVYIDESGCKLSKFRQNCEDLSGRYYKELGLMCEIARKIRAMHDQSISMPDWPHYYNNPIQAADHLMELASQMKGNLFERFAAERESIRRLYDYTERDGIEKRMCHNDINADNILITDTTFDIIDWEFAGYNDPAYDFGRVIGGYECEDPAVEAIVSAYLGYACSELELLHWLAYAAIHNWYYFNWALYVESIGNSSRDWMIFFYRQVKKFTAYCLPRYGQIYGEG